MAIFIDLRPKLDKAAITFFIITSLILLSGLKGCSGDYAKDRNIKTNTAVYITGREIGNGGDKLLSYKVGEYTGKISVTDETFASAKPGKTMYFNLSKKDYEGPGWLSLFAVMIILGAVGTIISISATISTIYNRYF